MPGKDWTADEQGRVNESPKCIECVTAVADILGEQIGNMVRDDWCYDVAKLIVSHLAHARGLAPKEESSG